MSGLIDDFKDRISGYDKDYKFSQEEVLNILARYEIKYRNVQTISLDKVKKVREKIENLNLNDYGDNLYQFQEKCTEFLDKLMAESR